MEMNLERDMAAHVGQQGFEHKIDLFVGVNVELVSTSKQAEGGYQSGQAKDMVAMQVRDEEAV